MGSLVLFQRCCDLLSDPRRRFATSLRLDIPDLVGRLKLEPPEGYQAPETLRGQGESFSAPALTHHERSNCDCGDPGGNHSKRTARRLWLEVE